MQIINNNFNIPHNTFRSARLNAIKTMKSNILSSRSVLECADKFENYAHEAKTHEKELVNKITNRLQKSSIGVGLLLGATGLSTSTPLLTILGALICGAGLAFAQFVLFPIQDKQRAEEWHNLISNMAEAGFNGLDNRFKYNIFFQKYLRSYSDNFKICLLEKLNKKFPDSEEKTKIAGHIIKNFGDYYWNSMIDYCIENSGDNNGEANYNNFRNLLKLSIEVYKMWHESYIQRIGCDIDKENDEMYKCFVEEYPFSKLQDSLPIAALKNKNGIITDEIVEKYADFAKDGAHQSIETINNCKNRDGSIAWDCTKQFRRLSVLIDNSPENDFFESKNIYELKGSILRTIAEHCYDENGVLDKNKLSEFYNKIYSDISTMGIQYSKDLVQIFNNQQKEALGIEDLDIGNIEEVIKEPSVLLEKYQDNIFYDDFINFIQRTKASPAELYAFLCHLTSYPEYREKFVQELSGNQRIGNELKELLINKLGDNKKAEKYFNTWFNDEKYGYRGAYKVYYDKFWNNASDLLEIIKQSPNINPDALQTKAKDLGVNCVLGNIPKDFSTENDFHLIMNSLRKLSIDISKKNTKNYKINDNWFELNINGQKYYTERIDKGHSTKEKYKIKLAKPNSKTYIIKFFPYNIKGNSEKSIQIRDSQMLRADSPYMNAMVDFYLKENGCKNSAEIKYFDYEEQAVLYEMTNGKNPSIEFSNAYNFNNENKLKDISDLGIIINDIYYTNLIETKDGTIKLIDSGHANYNSLFRPMVIGKHITLGNLCGRELNEV